MGSGVLKHILSPSTELGADEFFDPTANVSNINTFTKRDHIFAKLNLELQGGSVTLLHTEKKSLQAHESAFMQLEFSGIENHAWSWLQCFACSAVQPLWSICLAKADLSSVSCLE